MQEEGEEDVSSRQKMTTLGNIPFVLFLDFSPPPILCLPPFLHFPKSGQTFKAKPTVSAQKVLNGLLGAVGTSKWFHEGGRCFVASK